MHETNGIVIQLKSEQMRQFDQPESTTLIRQKRNSFKSFYGRELMPYVKSKNKDDPQTLGGVISNCNELAGMLDNRDDKVWYFSRYEHITHDHNTSEQKLLSWKGYCHLVLPQNHNDFFAFGYLPSINNSPAKYEVVQKILIQCKAKAEAFNLNVADLVLYHALYSKTLEILMKKGNENLRDFINLRMGGFHACCIFLSVIGKSFADASLKDLIIESRIMGEESGDQIMNGKHFNNAMRVRHAVAEVLTRKIIDSFIEWLKKRNDINILETFMSLKEIKKLQEGSTNEFFKSCELAATRTINLFEEFEQTITNPENSPMVPFWQSYLEMFELLLQFQKSIKSGNWELHLDSCEKLLPWSMPTTITIMLNTFHTIGHHSNAFRLPTHPCIMNL